MWWLLLLPVVDATLVNFEWDAINDGAGTIMACLDTTINITWDGNFNIVETAGAGCSSAEILTISGSQNAGHVQTFNIMGAAPGMTRYFKDTDNCQDAGGGFGRFQTYCAPAGTATTGPDDDFSCAAGLPDGHDCAGGSCVDGGCALLPIGSTNHTLLSGNNNEYCNDFAPLSLGYYPPVLLPGDPLYNPDKEVECRSRCLDECSSYESFYLLEFDGDTNQSLNSGGYGLDERRCACGAGDCSVRSAGEAGNVYSSYKITDGLHINQYQCTCASSTNPLDDGSNGGIYCIYGSVSGASDMFSSFHACSCLCDPGVTGVGCEILPAPEPGPATAPAANPSAPAQTESSGGVKWWHVVLGFVGFGVVGSALLTRERTQRYDMLTEL